MGEYPCLDEHRRYKSFPCSQCQAVTCIFGKKPASKPQVTLSPGQKACEVCGTPYQAYGKSKYCSDDCRRKAIAKQRRRRRNRVSEMIY
jgi:predicted nucleic acid-binding Zn ribbon protein